MKKKILIGVIITLLVAVIVVEGVIIFKQMNDKKGNGQEQIVNEVKETEEPTIKPETTASNNDELIYECLNVNLREDEYFKYNYKVPQINIDSSDVDKINNEIIKKWKKPVDERDEVVLLNDNILYGISYKYTIQDNILSLIILGLEEPGFAPDPIFLTSDTYNIDIDTGKQISNTELIEKYGLTTTEIQNILYNDVEKEVEKFVDTKYEHDEYYNRYRELTLSTAKEYSKIDNIEEAKIFINEKGNISFCLYGLGVEGLATCIFDLETGENEKTSVYSKDFIY